MLPASFPLRRWLCAAVLLYPLCLEARLNLPQQPQTVALRPEVAAIVGQFLPLVAGGQDALPHPLDRLLIGSLPEKFHEACAEVVEHWGESAKGSAEWRVRLLHRQPAQTWLAFRCGSRVPEYRDSFDERLALLRLDAAKLQILAQDRDAENDSQLYRLEFAQALPLAAAEVVAFRVTVSSQNPCCDGPLQRCEERLVLYTGSAPGVPEALSLVTRQEVREHDDQAGDRKSSYHADVTFERDPEGRVTAALARFRREVNGKLKRSGTLRYRWNPATLRFDQAK